MQHWVTWLQSSAAPGSAIFLTDEFDFTRYGTSDTAGSIRRSCDTFLGSRDCLPRLGNATRFGLLREVLVQLSCLHARDDGVECRDELILIRNDD